MKYFYCLDNNYTYAIHTDTSHSCHAPAFPETMHHFVWRLPCFLTWWFLLQNSSVKCSRHSAGINPNTYLVEVHAWLWKQNLFAVILLKRGANYFIGWLQNRELLSFSRMHAKGCTCPLRSWESSLIYETQWSKVQSLSGFCDDCRRDPHLCIVSHPSFPWERCTSYITSLNL